MRRRGSTGSGTGDGTNGALGGGGGPELDDDDDDELAAALMMMTMEETCEREREAMWINRFVGQRDDHSTINFDDEKGISIGNPLQCSVSSSCKLTAMRDEYRRSGEQGR